MARPLYCSFDPDNYFPEPMTHRYDLGYMGTYSDDRQPMLEKLLLAPARERPDSSFVVAGPQYPREINWPPNVLRIEHLPPAEHRLFYNEQRATLNITRRDMIQAGYAPSVRLFEAAACATPIVSDRWRGIEEIFTPGSEIILADSAGDVQRALGMPERELQEIGERSRHRVLAEHTAGHRAAEVAAYVRDFREASALRPV